MRPCYARVYTSIAQLNEKLDNYILACFLYYLYVMYVAFFILIVYCLMFEKATDILYLVFSRLKNIYVNSN